MLGFFGWKIALAYVTSGVVIGVAAGLILGNMHLERYLVKDMIIADPDTFKNAVEDRSFGYRIFFGVNEAKSIVKKLWVWILVGVGIGALIHNYIPQEAI